MRSAALMGPVVGRGACLSGSVTGGRGSTPPSGASGAAACWADSETGTARASAIRVRNDLMSRMGNEEWQPLRGRRLCGQGQAGNMTVGAGASQTAQQASDAREAPSDALNTGDRRALPE